MEKLQIRSENDRITVSFITMLSNCEDFKEFFIKVSELKLDLNRKELSNLQDAARFYEPKYGYKAIIFIRDMLAAEKLLPCNNLSKIRKTEEEYKKEIISNFNKFFPNYTYTSSEVVVPGVGRIDILAYCSKANQPVIIELKIKSRNPSQQLIAYGSKFENPILIGITETEIIGPVCDGIRYLTYKDIGINEEM